MSVCGEEQTPNNEREQVRSQKSAMGGCFGGLGAEPPAVTSQWGFGGKAPSRWRFRGKAPSHHWRHTRKFCIFLQNNFILGLF